MNELGGGIISQAIGGLMDMGVSAVNRGGNYRRNVKLMNRAHGQAVDRSQRLHELAMDMWNKTNYSAQIEQMRKAGLNPALMYEMGGAGGIAQSSAGGGAAGTGGSGGQGMGINTMDMANRAKESKATVELLEAQADNQRAEAEATRGYKAEEAGARIESLNQGVENQRANKKLTEIQTEIEEINKYVAENTASLNVHRVINEVNYMEAQIEYLERQNWIDEKTKNEKIELVRQEVTKNYLEQELTKSRTDLTRAEISGVATEISKKLSEIHYRGREIQVKEQEIMLKNERVTISELVPTAILDTARKIAGEKKQN